MSRQSLSLYASPYLTTLELRVKKSYAHNSKLYRHLETEASLEEIVSFLKWDAVQPAFATYLRGWLVKTPETLKPALLAHIHVEEFEKHSELFKDMLAYLESLTNPRVILDNERLERLNYTFSPECVRKESFAFFLGGFFATELMSQKRCAQILSGLTRLGIHSPKFEYFKIHADVDGDHYRDIFNEMIEPAMDQEGLDFPQQLHRGIDDRLERSSRYLKWYEETVLNLPSTEPTA